jgi:pyruvate decarboxylase
VFPFLAIGYIGIPIDLVNAEISVPTWPIEPMSLDIPPNPEKTHEAAKSPIIIVDACALRRNMTKDVQKLIDVSGFPTYVTPMGKGGVDEAQQAYRGCYAGDVSYDEVKQEVIKSDLILEIGGLKSDFNTGGFTYHLDREKIISFHSFNTSVFYATYEKVGKKSFTINMFMNVETSR